MPPQGPGPYGKSWICHCQYVFNMTFFCDAGVTPHQRLSRSQYHASSKKGRRKMVCKIKRDIIEICHADHNKGYYVRKDLDKICGHYKLYYHKVDESRAKELLGREKYVLADIFL